MSGFGLRGSAREKAEDAYHAKDAALRTLDDAIRSVRGVALDKIAALVRLHGDTPVSTATLRDILNASNKAIDAATHNYEAKVKQIEEAYK
jgi:hypothetical protein